MDHPLISIIVPVYKVESYLDKCVESLLCQTYDNYEILLIDDGSPDACPQICDKYAAENANIIAYHKSNNGLSEARNFGVRKANGDYIAFVDSDDYVEPSYISDMWRLLDENKADIAVTRVQREYKNKERRITPFLSDKTVVTGSEAVLEIYFKQTVGWHAVGKLYKKNLLLDYPFPDGYYEDFAVMYKILSACETVALGDFIGNYHYICRENSTLNSKIIEKHYRVFDICDQLSVYIADKYPNDKAFPVVIYKSAVVQILNLTNTDKATFKKIFNKYNKYFKRNYKYVKSDGRLTKKDKLMIKLLGGSSVVFRLAMWINNLGKK